jgi:predicted GNAT family acetyltransferase
VAELRVLGEDDRGAFEAFLQPRRDSSIFLLGNAQAVGFEDRGTRPSGTYLGILEGSAVQAVAAHFWNQNVILQADPPHVAALLDELQRLQVRPLGGLLGPSEQVAAALAHLGVEADELQLDEPEGLYRLDLADLRVPSALADGALRGRRGRRQDLPTLARWRADYNVETLGHVPGAELEAVAREMAERALGDQAVWLVESGGDPVAMAGFNARLPGLVQIGGVWTPQASRGRGYARAAVAAALLDAREQGDTEAILFTGEKNKPAVRAYRSLGFELCGTYRISLLRSPRWVAPG